MGLDVLFIRDVQGFVKAGVALTLRGIQHQGCNPGYVAGVLTFAEYMCNASRASWADVVAEVKAEAGPDERLLLDQILKLPAPRAR